MQAHELYTHVKDLKKTNIFKSVHMNAVLDYAMEILGAIPDKTILPDSDISEKTCGILRLGANSWCHYNESGMSLGSHDEIAKRILPPCVYDKSLHGAFHPLGATYENLQTQYLTEAQDLILCLLKDNAMSEQEHRMCADPYSYLQEPES